MTDEKKKAEVEKKPDVADEARTLGVKGSKLNTSRFSGKDREKETAKHGKLAGARLKNRVAKAKEEQGSTPLKRRMKMIKAKLTGRKSGGQLRYSDAVCKNMLAELKVIENTPKAWVALTKNGTKPYPIASAKIKSVDQMIKEAVDTDEMDLD